MIDLFCQEHSIGLSYQAQRGVSILLMVDQGFWCREISWGELQEVGWLPKNVPIQC
jgi:hypothetical protein